MKIQATKTLHISGSDSDGGVGIALIRQLAPAVVCATFDYTSPYGEGDYFSVDHFTEWEEACGHARGVLREEKIRDQQEVFL
ncbi:MAG: hypothetical protein C0610_16715 [Desulfobacteraceae bacterium]|nr:MAG: hypothetical protein C0610_16715 [Desulfobacteraceae bacterium]